MIREEIHAWFLRGVTSITGDESVIVTIEHPKDPTHGDYASAIALALGKKQKRPPMEVVQEIVQKLEKSPLVERVEVVPPGFINIHLSVIALVRGISEIHQAYQTSNVATTDPKAPLIVIEFTDPNPFKVFHLGHLYSNTVGECLSRLYESQGWRVARVCYQGDVGMHVAKAIWGMLQDEKNTGRSLASVEKLSLPERATWMGKVYAAGAEAYETDEAAKTEIESLNGLIYEVSERFLRESGKEMKIDYATLKKASNPRTPESPWKPDDVYQLWLKGREWSLAYFETIYQRLGTTFAHYYFESESAQEGYVVVKQFLAKGVFEVGDRGAIVFDASGSGLHKRVFINSIGLPTYEAKDLGLPLLKQRDFAYDKSLIITGNEQKDYFRVVLSALRAINPELGEKTSHLSHGFIRLPEGKMSSRTGTVIAAESLLADVKERVLGVMSSGEQFKLSVDERPAVAEHITIGAIKYALLKSNIGSDIVFDFNQSISFEGNSGPYLQYTYARARSIGRQVDERGTGFDTSYFQQATPTLNPDELSVLRIVYRSPEIVAEAAEKHTPHLLCSFLYDVAQQFNGFYARNRVLQADTGEQQKIRVTITAAVAQVLHNGLTILGIPVPEKM
ncbi:MAG: arginine--tRNA ligase [Parcubacteria group bacterium RIFCSPHIGHO2_01_FULL_47_10b]|nr:MAG: arginine--tRNA ligase [Parcubacteria group bacterium RIFCSPHIGHO2_01_FULL_47_10b]